MMITFEPYKKKQKIWKFEVNRNPIKGHIAKILKVAYQKDILYVWCLMDDNVPEVELEIVVAGTGWEIDVSGFNYLDSVFEGPFVWHIFYRWNHLFEQEEKMICEAVMVN